MTSYLDKYANSKETGLEVELGSPFNRGLAQSFGKMLGALSGTPLIAPGMLGDTFDSIKEYGNKTTNIRKNDAKAQMYKNLADFMYDADPVNLSDTKVYLGGGQFRDRLARILSNKRTSVLGKLFGLATSPFFTISSDFSRSDHYDPFSDSVILYSDNPAILTHELGHAVDMNNWRHPEKDKPAKGILGKLVKAIKSEVKAIPRDLYGASRTLIPMASNSLELSAPVAGAASSAVNLWQEGAANIRGLRRLNRLEEKHPEIVKNLKTMRGKTLPNAYSTYLLGAFLKTHPAALEMIGELQEEYGVDQANTIISYLFPAIAGTTRIGSSLITKGKYKDAYKDAKESLKHYGVVRKERNKAISINDIAEHPEDYDEEQRKQVFDRELKLILDQKDSNMNKLINALKKRDKDGIKDAIEKSELIKKSSLRMQALDVINSHLMKKQAIAVEEITDPSDIKDTLEYYKTLTPQEKELARQELQKYIGSGHTALQTLVGALRSGLMYGVATAGTAGLMSRGRSMEEAKENAKKNALTGGLVGGSIGAIAGGWKGYNTGKKHSANAKKLLTLLDAIQQK